MECCLKKECQHEHEIADEKYIKKLYRVGKLFGGDAVCLQCLFHLQDMVKTVLMDIDAIRLEQLKARYPNYWRLIEELGIDMVRKELGMTWLEAEPENIPSRPPVAPPEVQVGGTIVRR